MAPENDQNWEDILDERVGGKKPDKPVRLSDLAPPAGLGSLMAGGNPGFSRLPAVAGRRAAFDTSGSAVRQQTGAPPDVAESAPVGVPLGEIEEDSPAVAELVEIEEGKEKPPPLAAAAPPDEFDLAWKEAAVSSDVIAELNERLRQSEEARRDAQVRLAETEWNLTELREKLGTSEEARRGPEARLSAAAQAGAGDSMRGPGAALLRGQDSAAASQARLAGPDVASSNNGEVARLRRQLDEAYAIIRAIEAAYLAGEAGDGDGRSAR